MNNKNWEKLQKYLPLFAELDVDLCFLYITETAFNKSIIDATIPVTNFLKRNNLHDYSTQKQGTDNLKLLKSKIILNDTIIDFDTSLYRPLTKKGDNRIWFRNLKRKLDINQFGPDNFIALTTYENELYIFNLSDDKILESITNKDFVYNTLIKLSDKQDSVKYELLFKIKNIYQEGFIPTVVKGDTGIGMTLENKLGIEPNASKNPDYKGIELKTYRIGENKIPRNRSNLFTKVPDWKNSKFKSSKELLDEFGYEANNRININCTLKINKPNPQGLYLNIDKSTNKLNVIHETKGKVVEWDLEVLHKSLLKKHHETFWVGAETKNIGGIEHFKYIKITHTKNPKTSLFDLLIENGDITVDFIMHIKENGSARDHGYPFKISKKNLNKLFPKIEEYDLTTQ